MAALTATLWGCPGISVRVDRIVDGIRTPMQQILGIHLRSQPPGPRRLVRAVASEPGERFAIVVTIHTDIMPFEHIFVGDILVVTLRFDGFDLGTCGIPRSDLELNREIVIDHCNVNIPAGRARTFSFAPVNFVSDTEASHSQWPKPSPEIGSLRVAIFQSSGDMHTVTSAPSDDALKLPDLPTLLARPPITAHHAVRYDEIPIAATSTQYAAIGSSKTRLSLFEFWFDGAVVLAKLLRQETQNIANMYQPNVYPDNVPLNLDAAIQTYAATRNKLFELHGSQPDFRRPIDPYRPMPPTPIPSSVWERTIDTHPSASCSYATQPNERRLTPGHDLPRAVTILGVSGVGFHANRPNPQVPMPGAQYQGTGPAGTQSGGVFPAPTSIQASTNNSYATPNAQPRTGPGLAPAPQQMPQTPVRNNDIGSMNNHPALAHQLTGPPVLTSINPNLLLQQPINSQPLNAQDAAGIPSQLGSLPLFHDTPIAGLANDPSFGSGIAPAPYQMLRDSFSNDLTSSNNNVPGFLPQNPVYSQSTSLPDNTPTAHPLNDALTGASSVPAPHQMLRDSFSNEQAGATEIMPDPFVQQPISSERTSLLNNNPVADPLHHESPMGPLPSADTHPEPDKSPPSSKRKRQDSDPNPKYASGDEEDAHGSSDNTGPV